MKARIVIGANYGDEGKGTVVANYTKVSENVLNVLTNGGAQRGHSILTEDGNITFQHFGSGTYHGADNYYSRFFIISPMQFVKEYDALIIKPKNIYRDKECRWSTPYDAIANWIEEEQRNRTASCRMGIWNTIKRYCEQPTINLEEFVKSDSMAMNYLLSVKRYYENKITIPSHWRNIWESDVLRLHFLNDCIFVVEHTNTCELKELFYDNLIFENGQGLLLSDTGKDTFDTTPSNTGIRYALELLKDISVESVTAHYVTRPYLTRHGDGKLIGETKRAYISCSVNKDRTNHYNEGQGNFRYGQLDVDLLQQRIIQDAKNVPFVVELTHCDEMDRVKEFEKVFSKVKTYDTPFV